MPALELVVARYAENLNWLRRVPKAFRVRVYNKGAPLEGTIPLENHGNEAQTYLHHIVENYDALAETTVFAQGRPFDHVPDFHRRLRRLASGEEEIRDFRWLGLVVDHDDPEGRRLFRGWSKNPEGRLLDLEGFFQAMWGRSAPEKIVFFPGAQFLVRAEVVRRQSRDHYRKALELSTSFPDAGHCLERSWDRIFQCEGLPDSLRGLETPIYLRPIRRLGITWDEVPEEHRGW